MYARLKQDIHLASWNYMSRTNPANPKRVKLIQAPETFRLIGGTGQLNLKTRAINLVKQLNSPAAFKYVTRKGSGWVNKSPWPRVEQLSFACNVVEVLRIDGDRCYIDYLNNKKPFQPVNFFANPTLVHRFTVVTPEGKTVSPPKGDTYILVIANTEVFVNKNDIEFFPELGEVTVIVPTLLVRDTPNGNYVETLNEGDKVTILEYKLVGTDVWAKINDNKYIALAHKSVPNTYTTSWIMSTPLIP